MPLPSTRDRFIHYFDSVVPRNQNCYAPFNHVSFCCQKESEREATHIYNYEVPALRILKQISNYTTQHADRQINLFQYCFKRTIFHPAS